MSWQATAWAAKQKTGSPARKLLLLALHPGARITSAKSAVQALAVAEAIHRATAALTTGNLK